MLGRRARRPPPACNTRQSQPCTAATRVSTEYAVGESAFCQLLLSSFQVARRALHDPERYTLTDRAKATTLDRFRHMRQKQAHQGLAKLVSCPSQAPVQTPKAPGLVSVLKALPTMYCATTGKSQRYSSAGRVSTETKHRCLRHHLISRPSLQTIRPRAARGAGCYVLC